MTHLLDSSGFFAFFFDEPGRKRVEELFCDGEVGVSVLTSIELWARLKGAGSEGEFEKEWEDHLPLFDRVVGVDFAHCLKAIELRRAATDRVPTIDSVIAAAAAQHNAVLVHRDPHFSEIPASMLKQEMLSER